MTPEREAELGHLMAAAQGGDQHAYERLLTEAAGLVRRYVRSRAGQAEWVEDVVQESLLTLHRARRTYDPARPFGPWLYAIARSRLVDAVRRSRRRANREADLGTDLDTLPMSSGHVPGTDDGAARLHGALARLPAQQREVIGMLKLDESSVRETASRLGLSESNVKVIAHRGYKALRRILGGVDRDN
jgi:RNA polymerase sigma-70 factor (ECF subfamily)